MRHLENGTHDHSGGKMKKGKSKNNFIPIKVGEQKRKSDQNEEINEFCENQFRNFPDGYMTLFFRDSTSIEIDQLTYIREEFCQRHKSVKKEGIEVLVPMNLFQWSVFTQSQCGFGFNVLIITIDIRESMMQ